MHALEQYLAKKDLSQDQFGKQLGVSQASVSDWLRGINNPSIDSLKKIAAITGISIDKLLADKPE